MPRCLENWGVSCTPNNIECFKTGKEGTWVQAKVAACLSRSVDFAGILPRLSEKFILTACEDTKMNGIDDLAKVVNSKHEDFGELLRCHLEGEEYLPATVLRLGCQEHSYRDVFASCGPSEAEVEKEGKRLAHWPNEHYVNQHEEEELLERLYGIRPEEYERLLAAPFTIGGMPDVEYEEMLRCIFSRRDKA